MTLDVTTMNVDDIRSLLEAGDSEASMQTWYEITKHLFDMAYHQEGLAATYREAALDVLPSVLLHTAELLDDDIETLGRYLDAVQASCQKAVLTGVGSLLWRCSHDSNGRKLRSSEFGAALLTNPDARAAMKLLARLYGNSESELTGTPS